MRAGMVLALAMLLLGVPAQAQAQAQAPTPPATPGETAAERWLWEKLRGPLSRPDFAVDLTENCAGVELNATEDDPRWADPCRAISAAFLERILTTDPWRGQLPRRGVRLQGALVSGVLDLSSLTVAADVWLDRSRFLDPVMLTGARFEKSLTFDASALLGGLAGDQLQVAGNLQISGPALVGCLREGSQPCGPMVLENASVGADLRLEGATIATFLRADDMTVTGSLNMAGTTVEGGMLADNLKVGRNFHLVDGARLGCRALESGVCDALVLRNATVEGQFAMTDAVLAGNLQGNSMKVRNHLQLRNSSITHPGIARLNLAFAKVDGDLDLSNAELQLANLAGTTIGGDLLLATDSRPPPRWAAGARLSLRNAHAGALQGSFEPGHNAWPPVLELQGFVYDRLGGGTLDSANTMMARPSREYADWLARDRNFTRQPYQQLASVFTAAGDPDRATDILFAARYREEREGWKHGDYADALGLAALRITIGYGLGYKFFRVLWWVLGFGLLGTAVLWCSPAARQKGVVWCLGASLDQLVPFATLSPEFAPFFDDPGRERLAGWQVAFFAVQSLVGFLLGGFVGAGLGGLTQAT